MTRILLELTKAPDYADIFTLDEFLAHVECGLISDYDGSGALGTATHESNLDIPPSEAHDIADSLDSQLKAVLTHVMWYNK